MSNHQIVFFAGIPEGQSPNDASRDIIAGAYAGREVQYIDNTDPRDFVRHHSYKDGNGKLSVDGLIINVMSQSATPGDINFWNKLRGKGAEVQVFEEMPDLSKLSQSELESWATTGLVPASDDSGISEDDLSDFFDDDDELEAEPPKPPLEPVTEKLTEVNEAPVQSNVAVNPLDLGGGAAGAPSFPTNLQNTLDRQKPQEPEPQAPMFNQAESPNPSLPPFLQEMQGEPQLPLGVNAVEPPSLEDETPSQHLPPAALPDPHVAMSNPHEGGPQASDNGWSPEPVTHNPMPPEQPQQNFGQNFGETTDPWGNQQGGYHQPQQVAQTPYQNPTPAFQPEPVHQGYQQGGFAPPQVPVQDNSLQDQLLGGYPSNDGFLNQPGGLRSPAPQLPEQTGFQEPNYQREMESPYMQRMSPEDRFYQQGEVSRYENGGGGIHPSNYHAPATSMGMVSPKCIMFTGTRGGVGKTTLSYVTAMALALALDHMAHAQGWQRAPLVYLVETDYANPKMEERFKTTNSNRNLGNIATRMMQDMSSNTQTSDAVMGRLIAENSVNPENAPSNLRVIAAPYDMDTHANKVTRQYMSHAVTQVIRYLRESDGQSYVIIDSSTITTEGYDPIHKTLARQADRTVMIAWADNLDDTRRAAGIVSASGIQMAKIKVFVNKTASMDDFSMVQQQMVPYTVVGAWPEVPGMNTKWVGSPDVSDDDRRALIYRVLLFLKQLGMEAEVGAITGMYEPLQNKQVPGGKMRLFTRIFTKNNARS